MRAEDTRSIFAKKLAWSFLKTNYFYLYIQRERKKENKPYTKSKKDFSAMGGLLAFGKLAPL
ncbi:MAG: hypothetical protein ACI8P3_004122 [Saprospiraceae bacterium]|jgi:hypothetical protein